jgi:DNA-binding transcriptional LysR family regulator
MADEILPQDLPNIPLVLRERGSGTLDVFEKALQQHDLRLSALNVLLYLGSTESIKLFLSNSDCMGIVSVRSVSRELMAGMYRVIDIKGMPMQRIFSFAQMQGQEGGLAQVFMQYALLHNKKL